MILTAYKYSGTSLEVDYERKCPLCLSLGFHNQAEILFQYVTFSFTCFTGKYLWDFGLFVHAETVDCAVVDDWDWNLEIYWQFDMLLAFAIAFSSYYLFILHFLIFLHSWKWKRLGFTKPGNIIMYYYLVIIILYYYHQNWKAKHGHYEKNNSW